MKRAAVVVFLIAVMGWCGTAVSNSGDLSQLSDEEFVDLIRIHQLNRSELNSVLAELQRRFPDFEDRVHAIATTYLGAGYVLDPLTDELNNWLPFDKTNCTMFIHYVVAFTNAHSYAEALEHMRWLHYKQGIVGFKTRYHFTTDRITSSENPYFRTVTEQYVQDPAVLKQVTLTLNRKTDGTYLFGGRLDNWTREVTISYIPRIGFTPDLLRELPRVLGVAFVKRTNWEIGVVVGHEGFLIDGDLFHSGAPRFGIGDWGVNVIEDYLRVFPFTRWEGIILFRINEVSLPSW